MLENLQKSSTSHGGLQPNSQVRLYSVPFVHGYITVLVCDDGDVFVFCAVMKIGQEMSQNSFIQQYLAKQQELLRQRLEREAQQNEGATGKTLPSAVDLLISL